MGNNNDPVEVSRELSRFAQAGSHGVILGTGVQSYNDGFREEEELSLEVGGLQQWLFVSLPFDLDGAKEQSIHLCVQVDGELMVEDFASSSEEDSVDAKAGR